MNTQDYLDLENEYGVNYDYDITISLAIAAGISALWGPAHGGANEAVLEMLEEIGDTSQIPKYVAKAKDKNDPFRLMGFGHRVYKNYDPRARIIRDMCHEVLASLGNQSDPMFELAMQRLGSEPATTLMVGDRYETDIAGALALGMPTVGVLTGINSAEEFAAQDPPPALVVDDLPALLALMKEADPG